ncbi:uracil-xanthine permease family protein [Clostridium grantii]|uniref:Uracil permease n=1 Tax=Clostridium grantii DSM 8605 TaxID=1121316 RepID=A0A1M5RLY3_9CLOT|nr:uracil-xanthine permease family protein [Clostridium grantii]SHH27235.1 uracil permease [Clostridium grantii DSM 8605]
MTENVVGKSKEVSKGFESSKKVVLALQHLIAMFGATVLVPILTGFDPAVALICAGCGTLIFHFCTKKKVPVFLGSSFAFIGSIIMVKEQFGSLAYAQGGLIVAGLIYVLLSLVINKIGVDRLNKILPSHVIGPMIIVIGLSLLPVAIDMTGLSISSSAIAISTPEIYLAIITFSSAVLINKFAKGFARQLSILIAVIIGYTVASLMGLVDMSAMTSAPLVAIPAFAAPKFDIGAILIIAPVVLAVFMEHIGDITTNGSVVGKNFIEDPGLNRTLLGDGLATMFAGFIGGPANTTYGENTGVLAITKNYDPSILRLAAIFAIVLGFVAKIGGLLRTIPVPVMGGISFMLFGMIAFIGVRILKDNNVEYTTKNVIVMATIIVVGLGTTYLAKYFGISIGIPLSSSNPDLILTGLSLAALSGVILNAILGLVYKIEKA